MKRRYPCILQHDTTDCGAACLATISKFYGLKIPIAKIRETAGTDRQGTNVAGLVKAAGALGFSAKAFRGEEEALFSGFPLPCIAHVVTDKKLEHYVVIHKITRKGITIADPGEGLRVETAAAFLQRWSGVLVILTPTPAFQGGGECQNLFTRFFGLLRPQTGLLLHIFSVSAVITVLSIASAFYFQFLMDTILPGGLRKTLHVISVGVILLYTFKVVLMAFRQHMMLYLSQKLDIPLVLGYFSHVLALPMSFFGTRKAGEIISRFMDAQKIREAISGAAMTIMIDLVMALAGGVILFMQNRLLFSITLLNLALYTAVVLALRKPLRRVNREQMEDNSLLTSYLVEAMNGMETVKAFDAQQRVEGETERRFVRQLKDSFRAGELYNVQSSLISLAGLVCGVLILWCGTASVLDGAMTLGELLTFNALVGYFLNPIGNLINLQPTMQAAVAASDRLGEILDLTVEKQAGEARKLHLESLRLPVAVQGLDFRYGTRQLVLRGCSLRIAPGEKVALVGESGSGKTTLAKLLLRFYPYEAGEIFIGDYNIKDIGLECLRCKIAYISQETFLFSGTVRENLEMGAPGVGLDEIIHVCKLCRADEFISRMPQRYESQLEENGQNLSGGQRQRLAIARALLRRPDILILDEATSNLDTITEKAIEATIDTLPQGITTLMIAHRLSTIRRCDRIFVLDKGAVAEQGTHQELMARRGLYYSLWKDQLLPGEARGDGADREGQWGGDENEVACP